MGVLCSPSETPSSLSLREVTSKRLSKEDTDLLYASVAV